MNSQRDTTKRRSSLFRPAEEELMNCSHDYPTFYKARCTKEEIRWFKLYEQVQQAHHKTIRDCDAKLIQHLMHDILSEEQKEFLLNAPNYDCFVEKTKEFCNKASCEISLQKNVKKVAKIDWKRINEKIPTVDGIIR